MKNNFEGFENSIEHRQIFLWVDANFVPGYYTLKFTGKDTAVIEDRTGDSMNVRYSKELGVTEI